MQNSLSYKHVGLISVLLAVFLIVLSPGTATAQSCAVPPANLINWWQAENNADDSVGSSDGVLQNGTTFAPGNTGSAFDFDGTDDHITVANFSALDGDSQGTFEFWVNVDTTPSQAACNSGVCSIVLFSQNDWVFAIAIHDSLAIEVSRGNGSGWGSPSYTLSSGTLTGLNQWNHVAVVVNGTTDDIYINGVLDTTGNQDESAFATFGGLVFGAGFSGNYIFLGGQVDELSIYDRALSGSEIQAIYNAGTAGKCGGAQYNFTGFFQPVDNLPTLNVAKAGSAIPVKFSLGGYQGLDIFATGYPASIITPCGSTATDAIEQTVSPGSSTLSYSPGNDQYTYVWKTKKEWAGTCRTLVVKLNDNTFHYADFQFR